MGIPERQAALAQRLGGVSFIRVKIKKDIDAAENQVGQQNFPKKEEGQAEKDKQTKPNKALM
jgi:hypothetical protein